MAGGERNSKPSRELADLVREKKVIVCVGSGGVGKTTTSAAIALEAARMGKKVCVLTIDPAKRLANSLGLKALGNDERKVSVPGAGGELWAMMLDTKRTWDDLVARYAPDAATRERIFANHYYQQISSALAGSQEFMAMEKLEELAESGKYDLLVLDTPPTRHALDFLDAPKKMIGFMDESVLRLFLAPSVKAGKLGLGLLKTSGAWMFKVLEKITGFEVLREISDFIGSFGGMYGGFKERAAKVETMLRDDRSAFVLVTSPNPLTVDEAIYFFQKLKEYSLPFGGFVVNRFHVDALERRGAKTEWKGIKKDPERIVEALGLATGGKNGVRPELAEKIVKNLEAFQALAEMDAEQVERLRAECAGRHFWRTIPAFDLDVHDLDGLGRVNEFLFPEA